jgi:hypothetical protein
MILLDAFSSDNIPIHIITLEAFLEYQEKLKPGGLIVIHISNHYLDLRPVMSSIASKLGLRAYTKFSSGGHLESSGLYFNPARYVVMTSTQEQNAYFEERDWENIPAADDKYLWRDDFSNIVSVLKILNKSGD